MKAVRWLLVVLVLGVAAAIGTGRLSKRSSLPTLQLPDATTLAIRHVAFTNLHSWNPRGPVASFLSRWLPARFDSLLGLPNPGSTVSSDIPSLGIWLTIHDPATGTWVNPEERVEMELVDEDGCVFRASGRNSSSSWGKGRSPFHVALQQFSSFPKNRPTLTARIVDREGRELGRIALANPRPATVDPNWPAEELPAVRTTNGLSVTLKEIAVEVHQPTAWDRSPFDFVPRFELAWNDEPAPEWLLDGYSFRDPSGNFGSRLCPKEPAWRLHARFIKKPEATFDTNQLWDLGVLAIPADGTAQSLDLQHRFDPAVLRVFAFSGPGRYQFSNDVCVVSEAVDARGGMSIGSSTRNNDRFVDLTLGRPHLLFHTAGLNPLRRLSARATTDQGHLIGCRFPQQAGGVSILDFDTPPGTRALRVELIVQDPVEVEFTVRPPQPPAGSPAPSALAIHSMATAQR